jgi:hypothetical protein
VYQFLTFYQENNSAISDFRLKSRSLWNDHISYTRNVIISSIANLPDVSDVSSRLLRNQEDIGLLISPYYSFEEVATLVALLKQHIVIAVDVLNDVEGARNNWYLNGVELLNHMSSMNRVFWPVSSTEPLWSRHMVFTSEEMSARKAQDWPRDILNYDNNHLTINQFSDLFANGVIYQNMEKFSYEQVR